MTSTIRKALIRATIALALASLSSSPALADDVVVARDVTVRAKPSRRSEIVEFPAVGTNLILLDDGAVSRGYYHVQLPDGRAGWVYRTYVRRTVGSLAEALVDNSAGQLVVHYIDVDQANAALLEFPCGAVLIDAGSRGDEAETKLLAYLEAFFARRSDLGGKLAAIFVTHTHIDHNASLDKLVMKYRVGSYIHNGVARGSGRANAKWMLAHARETSPAIAFRAVSEADVEAAGTAGLTDNIIDPIACPTIDPRIRVLAGGRELPDGTEFRPSDWGDEDIENGNNHSLVIRVDFGQSSFLFPGDLENAGISDLLARYAGTTLLDTDVLEVSHHGAANGTTAAFLSAVSPQVAVMSMGSPMTQEKWTAWAYGHPRKATSDLLYAAVTRKRPSKSVMVATKTKTFVPFAMDRAIYATGWDGTIDVKADTAGRIQVTTAR
ncbi:MBL fold metallo-hydrolase [Novosphingobium sp.]|uniref:MBL fold metallo-hydrolase n=1 Tax=Novosphingobium sp. TaxID=1874826 RepID=UPI002616D89A|nr:MBL fold metallo-hydrolase [Novosphingobium sp.]